MIIEPPQINEKICVQFANACAGQLVGVQAFIGGATAQEVMKACSGKFMPVKQWLYFDCTEIIPKVGTPTLALSTYFVSS